MTDKNGENTAVAQQDHVKYENAVTILASATGYKKDLLKAMSMSLLPKTFRGQIDKLGLYIMRCLSVGVDPMGDGVYAADIHGLKVMLHYLTYIALAFKNDLVERDGWFADCVYEGENFVLLKNGVEHERIAEKRHGAPVGAYAIGQTKEGMKEPMCIYVAYKDYCNSTKDGAAWITYASIMIRKVAIKELFKNMLPEIYAGVYMADVEDPNGVNPLRAEITDAEKDALVDEIFPDPEPVDADEAHAEMDEAEKAAIERDEKSKETKGMML